jgi:hypothetical protein
VIDISSGHAGLDAFLSGPYQRIHGMSSRFAAAICGHLIRRQTEYGIKGDLLEVGTFEGRFFVATGLLLQPGEHALGIDLFDWPDPGVYDRLLGHCDRAGLRRDSVTAWKVNTRTLSPDDLRGRLPGGGARFIHVDSEHTPQCLTHDLMLAHSVLHPEGVMALDDMLHPGYPTLVVTVLDYLEQHPEMRVLCIIDRESITAAAKFLICRVDRAERYERDLMTSFAKFHYLPGAQVAGHLTLVLTSDPTLPEIA